MRASPLGERGNQRAMNPKKYPNTFDCFGCRLAMTQAGKELANTQHNKPTNNLPNHLKRIPIFLNHLWNFQIILRITDNHGCDSSLNRLLGI